jgi:hypothetical protein
MKCGFLRLISAWVMLAVTFFVTNREAVATESSAADHVAVLAPFVNDDTCIVGCVDLAAVDVGSSEDAINKWIPAVSDQGQTVMLALNAVGSVVKTLRSSGVGGVYVVAGLKDGYYDGGPLVIVTTKSGSDVKAVETMLQSVGQMLSFASAGAGQAPKVRIEQHGGGTILVGTESTVARYNELQSTKRDDLVETLAKLAGDSADVSAVFSPGPDFRRVIRELWPALPEPMTPLRGDLADKWLRLEFSAKSRPTTSAQLCLQATDPQSAQVFVDLLRALPECAQFEHADRQQKTRGYLQTIVEALPARTVDARVTVQLQADSSQLEKLRSVVADFSDAALEKSRHSQRVNQFKQLGLAMLNFVDVNKHFPASAAIRDKDGKPLLSWRVAILPYIEERDLYKQFHLDEPWDSPHNREVAKKMPEMYADPDPKIRGAAGEGKTTYVVPFANGTVFDSAEGCPMREIKDGTSKTAMIVEVVPERAVEWTKPADWDVDMDHPLAGVARMDRHQFAAAYCDDSVRLLPVDIKPDAFRAILTRAGGETVDTP